MNWTHRKEISPKMQAKWLGPCVVTEKINDMTYKLQMVRDATVILHFDLLKPYYAEEVPPLVVQVRTCLVEQVGAPLQNTAQH